MVLTDKVITFMLTYFAGLPITIGAKFKNPIARIVSLVVFIPWGIFIGWWVVLLMLPIMALTMAYAFIIGEL